MLAYLIKDTNDESDSSRLLVPNGNLMSRTSYQDEAQASEDTIVVKSQLPSASVLTPHKEPPSQSMDPKAPTVRVLCPSKERTVFSTEAMETPTAPLVQPLDNRISPKVQAKQKPDQRSDNGKPRYTFKDSICTQQKQGPRHEKVVETRESLQGQPDQNCRQFSSKQERVTVDSKPEDEPPQAFVKNEETAKDNNISRLEGSKDYNHYHIHHHYYSPNRSRHRRRYHSWHNRHEYSVSTSNKSKHEPQIVGNRSKAVMRRPTKDSINARDLEHIEVIEQPTWPRHSFEDLIGGVQWHNYESAQIGRVHIYTHVLIPKSKTTNNN